MKLTNVTLTKQLKIGLPQFSNVTIGTEMTWELKDSEDFDFPKGWDIINQQLELQAQNGQDPSWMIKREEYKNHYSTTIKSAKNE